MADAQSQGPLVLIKIGRLVRVIGLLLGVIVLILVALLHR